MEKIVRQSLLFDFYGELLTEHQREIYEDCVMNDMSYTEVAGIYGISRQGVYDMIHRCDRLLGDSEEKLALVKRFLNARELADEIDRITGELLPLSAENDRIKKLSLTLREKTKSLLDIL